MCGITGFFSYKNKIDPKKFYKAHLKIAHRGPDDEGFIYKNDNGQIEHLKGNDTIKEFQNREHVINKSPSSLILGHRRLSIIDLTSHGHQPYVFKNLYLVYNGEIYNYIELRDELKKFGYNFETETDTEVFLKAYHCWGVDAFNKFNGMWAAAIYDSKKDKILLTRDRFGIKPLYYSLINDSLIFGSEIKFIAPFFKKLESNEQMVYDYIEHGYISHTNETFFKDIYQLKTGHYAIYNKNGWKEKEYFLKIRDNKCKTNVEEIREILIDSIRLRMRSDVPVGSLLSGGMDSSSIVCILKNMNPELKLNTYTITFKEKEFDYEAKYVKDIVKMTNIKNYKVWLQPDLQILDKLTYIIESPYRSITESAMFNIYNYIHNNSDIKVLLNGEGADEVFSGYNFHYAPFLLSLLRKLKIKTFIKEYNLILSYSVKTKKELFKEMLIYILKDLGIFSYLKDFKNKNFYNKKFKTKVKKYNKDILRNEIYINRYFSALPEYLLYADKISMYSSIEVRVPFLDYRLVRKADCLENEQLIKDGIRKWVLRESVKTFIPKSVYERKDKKGFFTPFELWLKTELKQNIDKEMLDIKNNGLFDFMNKDKIYNYYKNNDINTKIWRIYCLSRWKKTWKVAS